MKNDITTPAFGGSDPDPKQNEGAQATQHPADTEQIASLRKQLAELDAELQRARRERLDAEAQNIANAFSDTTPQRLSDPVVDKYLSSKPKARNPRAEYLEHLFKDAGALNKIARADKNLYKKLRDEARSYGVITY